MKFALTIALITSIASVAIFGALLMLHEGGADGHGICLPGLIDLRDCPPGVNPLEYVGMHMGALKELTAPPVSAAAVAFLAFILLIYALRTFTFGHFHNFQLIPLRAARASAAPYVPHKLFRWFAVHERRNPSHQRFFWQIFRSFNHSLLLWNNITLKNHRKQKQ